MDGDDGIVWYLRSREEHVGSVRILNLEGRVSTRTAADLARWLGESRGIPSVVLDLSGVDYLSGAGLRVLSSSAAALGAAGGAMIVCGLRPALQAVFDMAGPIPHLSFEHSADTAVRRLLQVPMTRASS